MGNEQSHLSGLEIDEKAVEVSDFWSQHSAFISEKEAASNITVFIGEVYVNGALWTNQTPLEKSSKNLMIYRHPCIVKYISSWQKNSKYFLAVEEVTPLSQLLKSLNSLQICVGLHSILKALIFLHEKANVSHNNVCIASIYVTKDGNWKLGGMEYLCSYKDLSPSFLTKTKSSRYNKAIDNNEEKHIQVPNCNKDFIDVFAFAVLASETLKLKTDSLIEVMPEFLNFCKNSLQNIELIQRPKLVEIAQHEFFKHNFIAIHSFLVELPLKNDDERKEFFSNLIENLRNFDEIIVASQLGSLLLSRMVLLNQTAQVEAIPFLLTPKEDSEDGLFTKETFKKHITPKLLEIFRVRDAQIRLLLLNHFSKYLNTFSKEELKANILPELLLGIKDTNDELVCKTLRTLSDLVLILGSATVIGGKRAKLFNDGRPVVHVRKVKDKVKLETVELTNEAETVRNFTELPERPRPDGEEEEESTEEIEASEDADNWEDWDLQETNQEVEAVAELVPELVIGERKEQVEVKKSVMDISELDIKSQRGKKEDDFDFFQDMEPVIETNNKFLIEENVEVSDKLAATLSDNAAEEGWGNEEWD